MSVTTTFDEKISAAKEKLKEAQKLLTEAADEDTWGHSDMKASYIDTLLEVISKLMEIRRKL